MRKVKLAGIEPKYTDWATAKVTTMGNITEVLVMEKAAKGPPVKKLDKDYFYDLRTGEVMEYTHGETRADSIESMRRTLARIRALVNTNVTEAENIRWVTLTYKENMTDTKKLYADFKKFWQRFLYWCETNGYEKPEYITVIEPQGRGAWHAHSFFIWPEKAPFIPNNTVLEPMWGHGFTKIKAVDDCDNIGAYFSAYLGDIPLDDVKELPEEEKQKVLACSELVEKSFTNAQELTKTKQFLKGGRLALYPAGMNIVRKTKGIKEPSVEKMQYGAVKKKMSSAKLTFSRTYEIVADDGSVSNTLSKYYYNSKPKKNQ